jgi:hypothetical protein
MTVALCMSIVGMLDFIMCQAERQIRVITINTLIIFVIDMTNNEIYHGYM